MVNPEHYSHCVAQMLDGTLSISLGCGCGHESMVRWTPPEPLLPSPPAMPTREQLALAGGPPPLPPTAAPDANADDVALSKALHEAKLRAHASATAAAAESLMHAHYAAVDKHDRDVEAAHAAHAAAKHAAHDAAYVEALAGACTCGARHQPPPRPPPPEPLSPTRSQ